MKQITAKITDNRKLREDLFEMKLQGDMSAVERPGQFVNILIPGCYLRRPVSICNKEGNNLTLIYREVGKGTEQLAKLQPGQELDLLTGLGNGYDLKKSGRHPLLIGGGVGIPPLYWLCRRLCREGKEVTVILGFNTAAEIFYEKEFSELGARLILLTADGSRGRKGLVTDAMDDIDYSFFYTCGPVPMFKAIEGKAKGGGEFSFEERMGCGFGACMGCSVATVNGRKRICHDGPVLEREEIIWI